MVTCILETWDDLTLEGIRDLIMVAFLNPCPIQNGRNCCVPLVYLEQIISGFSVLPVLNQNLLSFCI